MNILIFNPDLIIKQPPLQIDMLMARAKHWEKGKVCQRDGIEHKNHQENQI